METDLVDSPIGLLLDQLSDPNQQKLLDSLLTNIYGLVLTFLSDELTVQQRQIWLTVCKNYPKSSSGTELAKLIGASQVSKTIYKSINELEARSLINVHRENSRSLKIQADPEHPLTQMLIDLTAYYGG